MVQRGEREIGFNPNAIARVLGSTAEPPSAKLVREALEAGVDLSQENIVAIFLFNQETKVEAHLLLYPDKKSVTLHRRLSPLDMVLGTSKIEGITSVKALSADRYVRFISKRVDGELYLKVSSDCVDENNMPQIAH